MKRPVKILQFGAGNFLRGFCDWMVDVLNETTSFNGNVQIVAPLRPGNDIRLPGSYSVTLNEQQRVITCVDSVINPHTDYDKFLSLAENTDLEFIFSNTTEAGIFFNPNDQRNFAANATALLHHRYKHNKKVLTFLPCELIEKNGDTLRSVINQYVDLWKLPADFKQWVNSEIVFCNTLVDRIVTGLDDFNVKAEPFHLWIIEGPQSILQRLPFDQAGLNVQFVDNLAPYRTRKVRILNGAHTTLVPVAYLKGFRTVREAVEDREMGDFLLKAIHEEIIPTLDLPKEELEKFAADTIERFKNPFIRHELASIALNSTSKFKVRVLPSILEYFSRKKKLPERLVHSLACLIAFYKREDTPVNDDPEIVAFIKNNDLPAILANEKIWGTKLDFLPLSLFSSQQK